MKTLLRLNAAVFLLSFSPFATPSDAQELMLRREGKVQMLQLRQGDPRAFFRADLKVVQSDGSPAQANLPKLDNLKELIQIQEGNGKPFNPFYASGLGSATSSAAGRDVMLLVDVSGSMNARLTTMTRFEAAKSAVERVLQNFRDDVDNIAVVPFESHDVVQRITNAPFVNTRAGAIEQINRLPTPISSNNTALYSATVAALETLRKRKYSDISRKYLLVVLTDGKNDVSGSTDDKELLGQDGLAQIITKAAEVEITTFTVGIGQPGIDYDASVLENMAYPKDEQNFFQASDAQKLSDILRLVEQKSLESLRIAFFIDGYREWRDLPKELIFNVQLNLPSGGVIKSENITWSSPSLTSTSPVDNLTREEATALQRSGAPSTPEAPNPIWRLAGIFALISGGLAFLWFIPPRLIWPRPGMPQLPGRMLGSQPRGINIAKTPTAPKSQTREPGQGSSPAKTRNRFEETKLIASDQERRRPK